MGEAFITRRGGGPAGLNFEVVGGTTQPKNPKENTIWINTAQEITRWDFSAEHPYLVSKTKNFICYPFYDPTGTTNGVAYTDNGDGTVKANGTAIEDATFRLSFLDAVGHATYLPAGKYFLSGCPAGGSSTRYRVEAKSVSSGATLAADYGAGAGFELDAPDIVRCNIVVAKGATASNLTFKPQLEKGSAATAFVKGDATGHVWISTGTSSAIKFNALKKNGIRVCPISARQYKDVTSFRYIKLQMNALYSSGATVQFSDIRFVDDNGSFFAYPSGTSVISSIAAASTSENESKLIDNNANTKFCSGKWVSGSYILIDLGVSGAIDIEKYKKWQWYTAQDAATYPERNLKSFSLWGSNDGNTFALLDSVTDYSAPLQNSVAAYTGSVRGAVAWTEVTEQIYQSGKWVDFVAEFEIFASGKGSVASATAKARNQGKGTIAVSSNGITIGFVGDWAGTDVMYYTDEPIDITNLNTIKLTAKISEMRTSDHYVGFGLVQSNPPVDGGWADQNWVATTEISDNSNTSKTFTCNISNVPPGKYYFLFAAAATKGTITDIRIV